MAPLTKDVGAHTQKRGLLGDRDFQQGKVFYILLLFLGWCQDLFGGLRLDQPIRLLLGGGRGTHVTFLR